MCLESTLSGEPRHQGYRKYDIPESGVGRVFRGSLHPARGGRVLRACHVERRRSQRAPGNLSVRGWARSQLPCFGTGQPYDVRGIPRLESRANDAPSLVRPPTMNPDSPRCDGLSTHRRGILDATRRSPMLTGLEQYSLERAGYFIRRGFAPADLDLPRSHDPAQLERLVDFVTPIAIDVVGPNARFVGAEVEYGEADYAEWRRGYGILWNSEYGEQMSLLARTHAHLQVRIALKEDESLLLLPGTHASPPVEEDRAALVIGDSADTPGQVRVRLGAGDTLFWNTNVLHRIVPGLDNHGPVLCVTYVSQNVLNHDADREENR